MKNFFLLFATLAGLSLLVSACQTPGSQAPFTGAKHSGSSLSTPPQTLPKALVFYASDDPLLLPYFSRSFTQRLKDDSVFLAEHNAGLNKQWLAKNALILSTPDGIDGRFQKLILQVRHSLQNESRQKAQTTATEALKEARRLLSLTPNSATSEAYAELSFWTALTYAPTSGAFRQSAVIYEKYASTDLKKKLESQASTELAAELKKVASPLLQKQKNILLRKEKNCLVAINGEQIHSRSTLLPLKVTHVLSAACDTGFDTQTFLADKVSSLSLHPYASAVAYEMPTTKALPWEQIAKKRPAAVVLVYWSHKKQSMDAQVIDGRSLRVLDSLHLDLTTKEALNQAGDNLLSFIKKTKQLLTSSAMTR